MFGGRLFELDGLQTKCVVKVFNCCTGSRGSLKGRLQVIEENRLLSAEAVYNELKKYKFAR